VVGSFVLSLLLLFVISMMVLGFVVFWFLVGFRFCCPCNDVLLGCVVESGNVSIHTNLKNKVVLTDILYITLVIRTTGCLTYE
jgi:hypothetical protein